MTDFTKKRGVLRTMITKSCNILLELLCENPDVHDISARFSVLEKRFEELSEVNNEITSALVEMADEESEELLIKELTTIDEYSIKFYTVKAKVEDLLRPPDDNVSGPSSPHSECTVVAHKMKIRLPTVDFIKFDGYIGNWIPFWSTFSIVHDDPELSNSTKFQYLLQSTTPGSRARALLDSFPPSSSNYPKAVDAMKSRFGREDMLIEHYIREMLKLVLSSKNLKISSLYDNLKAHLSALETLNVVADNYAAILFPLIESCIPSEVLKVWQRSVTDHTADFKTQMDNLMSFLEKEVRGEERVRLASSHEETHGYKKSTSLTTQSPPSSAAALANLSIGDKACAFCNGATHDSVDCFKAQRMTLVERWKLLKGTKRCLTCTRSNHDANRCRAQCIVCNGRHVPILCPNIRTAKGDGTSELAIPGSKSTEVDLLSINHSLTATSNRDVLLQTFLVVARGENDKRQIRVLIDSGSQRSYICRKLAVELEYKPIGKENTVHSLFGGGATGVVKHNCYKARLWSLSGDFGCRLSVLDQDKIASAIPTASLDADVKKELSRLDIHLCEDSSGPIDLLLGADVAGKLWTGKRIVLSSGLVVVHTHFGWTLMGCSRPVDALQPSHKLSQVNLATTYTMMSVTQSDIADLWKLEAIGITDPAEKKSRDDRRLATLEHFKSTVKFTGGRYQVRLPWKEDAVDLLSNRDIAESRLQRNSAKLKRNQMFADYDSIFQEWLKLQVIEQAEETDKGHFLPHRPVVKESSTSTRVRPVFDASARHQGYASLNDCLEEGPNLIELLPAILMRFREKRVGISADIEKAFLQISIHPDDRDFLKFLWWKPGEEEVITYRHARVVFGVSSSPFLLRAVLVHHLTKQLNMSDPVERPYFDLLKKGFYVDNLAISLDRLDEVATFQNVATDVLSKGGFNLRAWEFSYQQPVSGACSVLGIKWNKSYDTISLNLDWWEEASRISKPTKRNVLSIGQRIFDPVGFSVPATLQLKLLVQDLWAKKIGWDDPLEAADERVFQAWCKDIHQLKNVNLSRCLGSPMNKSLHVFCDGSRKAYAAAVFVRSEENGIVTVELIQAKTRVAPLKMLSIPRLELLAATIGARLLQSVQEALQWSNVPAFMWTDSSTILAWIQRKEEWTVFVRNRIKEIRDLSKDAVWRHLPGEFNPADLPSRGCTVSQLLESQWWLGPDWLRQSEEHWPVSHCSYEEEKISNEKLKKHIVMLNFEPDFTWLHSYFSKYEKIVRMVAWIKRFSTNCKKRRFKVTGPLSVKELESAELSVVKLIQSESLLSSHDKRISELQPFVDGEGVLRLKTKVFERVDEEKSFKTPALLPSNHPVVERLVYDLHCRFAHVGAQTLLGLLREKFWILKGRQAIRRIISQCVTCKRFLSKPFDMISPPLPEARVRNSQVFEVTGVDYAGPLFIRDGSKVWISLFTCANFRAVHMELVPSLSSETFILALRRFIARRGRPKIIYSDNGTNFHGTENAFEDVDWRKVATYCSAERIQWRFNPPTAAWWGGFWERMVGLVKQLLRKTLGRASLDLDELSSIVCDCESLINSRPLTHVSESSMDPIPLTPAMFLQDLQMVSVPECDIFEGESLNKRLRHRQSLRDHLRQRFRSEYLGQLTWCHRKSTQEPSVGEVVLVGYDNIKRLDWPLAIVERLVIGRDGRVRVLHLRTSSGTITRAIQRVYPLEISIMEPEADEWTKDPGDSEDLEQSGTPSQDEKEDQSVEHEDGNVTVQQVTRGGRRIIPPKKLDL